MKKIIAVLSLLAIVTAGCNKVKVSSTDYPDFLGNWYSYDDGYIELDIYNTNASWVKTQGIGTTTITGNAKIIPGKDMLKIFSKKFAIDQYPTDSITFWTMTLDGNVYYRN